MNELLYKLELAISEEKYEDAAKIKIKIDELKKIYDSFFNN